MKKTNDYFFKTYFQQKENMLYSIIECRIGVLAMQENQIVEKLKLDIEEKERSYQKELQKIRKEDNLLNYIKGMLDITKNDVSNFPYYEEDDASEDEEARDNFNLMLKYTLKEDNIIASFKAEIKNLYYLEKIGYQQAEQYQEIKKKIAEYRKTIEESYKELITNETLKNATAKKENILKKLDNVKDHLEEPQEEIENIDSFYEGLQYAHLSESEKTSILLSVFEKNLKIQQEKLESLNKIESEKIIERKIGRIKQDNITKVQNVAKNLEYKFPIRITYPKISREEELERKATEAKTAIQSSLKVDRFIITGEN